MRSVAVLSLLLFPGAGSFAREPVVTLDRCLLLMNRFADGDSFHVSANGKEYIFRLYFVDAPETDTDWPDRVKTQANYFGLTTTQAIELGQLARQFTREKLSRPFTVRTRWEDARGDSQQQRFYAFVQTPNGDLGEQLVENGLARVFGKAGEPGEMATVTGEWEKLRRLEQKARSEKVGGWGAGGRLTNRARDPESGKGVDPFDAFFHPQKLAMTPSPSPEKAGRTTDFPSSGGNKASGQKQSAAMARKLDVNTASKSELDAVPGIGSALAGAIIAGRPFATADDLKRVKGIGSGKKYDQIRQYFR